MNRAHISLAPAVAFAVALFAGCTAESKSRVAATHNNAPAAAAPVPVQVFEVLPAAADGPLVVPAFVSVEDTALVLAQRDGVITKLEVQEGARVSANQLVATLSSDDQMTRLRQAELEVSRLKVEERQYESLVGVNRNELEREQALFKEGVSSQRDLERARLRLDGVTSELEKTKLATRTAQETVASVRFEIEKGTIRAPIAGIVTRRHVNLGSSVEKGAKVIEISRLAPLQVRFQLPQAERGQLAPGSIVSLTLPGATRAVAQARVRRLDPVADATSNTFGYLADVIGGGAGLIPGTAVNVHVARSAAAQSFWVPRAAFPAGADLRAGATATLLVVEDGRCAARTVLLDASEGDLVEVVNNLSAGDRVILAPPPALKTGDPVAF